jgi:hypothetical protein
MGVWPAVVWSTFRPDLEDSIPYNFDKKHLGAHLLAYSEFVLRNRRHCKVCKQKPKLSSSRKSLLLP